MRKAGIWILTGLTLLVLGCVPATSTAPSLEPGLQISSMWTSIGAADGSPDRQTFSYTIVLQNKQWGDAHINWVKPVLSDRFAERVSTDDRKVTVDEALAPGASFEISGRLQFDATGLSKAQILALEPFLKAMRVSSERVLELPARRQSATSAGEPTPSVQAHVDIAQVRVTTDRITFKGQVSPASGVCVRTQLLMDNAPVPWWPADVCATIGAGTWTMTVSLGVGDRSNKLDSAAQYMLRAWLEDNPSVETQFWFDLAAPPAPPPTPDAVLLLPEPAVPMPIHRTLANLDSDSLRVLKKLTERGA